MYQNISMKLFFLLACILPMIACSQTQLPFQKSALPVDERVNDLVSRLTLEEKVSQMVYNSVAIERLGIPSYNWWNEALHGIARNGIATVFPQSIGLAATWDTSLIFRVATVISDEARAKYNKAMRKKKTGINEGITLWSPNVNIFRDPRWGRGMETYGEDPYLTGETAVQFIKGLQGSDSKYLKTIATPKHIAVHSGPEPDRHTFNAQVSDYDLRETYLAQFEKCVREGKAASVMCAYNRLRDEACCGSSLLEKSILRNEWKFQGLIVSDCWAVPDMYNFHHMVNSIEEAAAIAVKSGTDLECGNSYQSLGSAVKQGLITEAELDVSVKRIFTARMNLGMFDSPDLVPYTALNSYNTEENKAVALEAAKKSMVLLKNASHTLPLRKNLTSIAVLGPNANDIEVLLGNYNGFPSLPVTPFQGIKNKVPNATVLYERGCDLVEGVPSFDVVDESMFFTSKDKQTPGLQVEYFDNTSCTGRPLVSRIDKKIDAAWWDGSPDERIQPDSFGVRWTGVIVPKISGTYALGGYGFNGFRIHIDDTVVAKYDGEFDPVKTFNAISLTAGKPYSLQVEFYKKSRYAFMQLIWSPPDEHLEERAIDAAKKAEVVVMCMGLSPRLEGEEMKVELEGFKGGDRTTLDLPTVQLNLIKKIYALGKPVVLVLLNGSAVAVNWEHGHLDAILEAWYPGQAAGTAIADILFGDENPSGKLPLTFYQSVTQLPAFNDYHMKNRTYRYFTGKPLYPFGYGLSYSTFQYRKITIDKNEMTAQDTATLSLEISNTGTVAGAEVVQLYVKAEKDTNAIKTLKGFQKIFLHAGETRTMTFSITPEKLSRWIDRKGLSVERDHYMLMVGGSSEEQDALKVDVLIR